MPKPHPLPITKEERNNIVATAATLKEASDHLYSLATTKTQDLVDARWLIRQTYITLLKLMEAFDIEP